MGTAPVEAQPFPATAAERWFFSGVIGSAFAAVLALSTAVAFSGDWRAASVAFAASAVATAIAVGRWLATSDADASHIAAPTQPVGPVDRALRTCRHCGDPFASRRPNQVYCAAECRRAASRQRRRARELRAHVHLLNEASARRSVSRR